VQLGLKPSRVFSSAAHFLTLERGTMETSTPLDAVLGWFPAAADRGTLFGMIPHHF